LRRLKVSIRIDGSNWAIFRGENNMRKIASLAIILLFGSLFLIAPVQADSGVQLSLISDDVKFYDRQGNEIIQASKGDIVTITATIRNFGNATSDYIDVEFHYDRLSLIETKMVMVPGNDLVEVSISWDTGERAGDLEVEVGSHRIYVSYYPSDPNTYADDNNSGGIYSNYFQITEEETPDACASVFIIGILMLIPGMYFIKGYIGRYKSKTY
jgi:hypothetical protein